YLSKALWPSNLLFIYPRWDVDPKTWWHWLFPIAVVCLLGLAWILRKSWSWLLGGLLIFGAILFPILGFFNVVFFRLSFVSDHFQYLAILGVIVPVSAGGTVLLKRLDGAERLAGYGLVFVLLGGLAVLTSKHTAMYHDGVTCWRMLREKNPS